MEKTYIVTVKSIDEVENDSACCDENIAFEDTSSHHSIFWDFACYLAPILVGIAYFLLFVATITEFGPTLRGRLSVAIAVFSFLAAVVYTSKICVNALKEYSFLNLIVVLAMAFVAIWIAFLSSRRRNAFFSFVFDYGADILTWASILVFLVQRVHAAFPREEKRSF